MVKSESSHMAYNFFYCDVTITNCARTSWVLFSQFQLATFLVNSNNILYLSRSKRLLTSPKGIISHLIHLIASPITNIVVSIAPFQTNIECTFPCLSLFYLVSRSHRCCLARSSSDAFIFVPYFSRTPVDAQPLHYQYCCQHSAFSNEYRLYFSLSFPFLACVPFSSLLLLGENFVRRGQTRLFLFPISQEPQLKRNHSITNIVVSIAPFQTNIVCMFPFLSLF